MSPKTRATVSAGGGTWTYGIDGQWCISYYNHNSKRHRATAKMGMGLWIVHRGCRLRFMQEQELLLLLGAAMRHFGTQEQINN